MFTADPGAGFPAGAPEGAPVLTWHGILHEASHLVVVVAWIALCFVLRTRFAGQGDRGWARACVAAVPIAIALVAFPHLDSFPVRIVVASVLQLGFVGLAARRLGSADRLPPTTRGGRTMKYMILTYGSQQDYDGMAGQATDLPAWTPEDFAGHGRLHGRPQPAARPSPASWSRAGRWPLRCTPAGCRTARPARRW